MSFFVFCLAVVLISGQCSTEELSKDTCEKSTNELCATRDTDKAFQSLRTVLPDIDFLNEHCDKIISLFQCVADYEQECSTVLEESEAFGQDLLNIATDICDENSRLGREYREHVTCLNNLIEVERNFLSCLRKVDGFLRGFFDYLIEKNYPELKNDEDEIEVIVMGARRCLSQNLLYNCTMDVIRNKCGAQAENMSKELINKFKWMEYSEEHCSPENGPEYLKLLDEYITELRKDPNTLFDYNE